jgi:DNA phosphorothioation-associated putative methyltransferase
MPKRALQVGKRVRDALYVHRDALIEIDASVRRAVEEAAAIVGSFHWNVTRIEPGRIALLEYDDFEAEPFPALRRSALVDLAGRSSKIRDFSSSANPPILHRKELLLPSAHPRRSAYAALTAELDRLNLFVDNHKIGLRTAWQLRLDEAGIVIRNHAVVPADAVEPPPPAVQVNRHKTAIPRNSLSSPMQMFARHGFLEKFPHLFDFGCGQGDDLRALQHAGVAAAGWDPHFRPDAALCFADLVNLGFVLNVIEDPEERLATMKRAWELTKKVLAVAVMVEGHYSVQGLTPFGDGFLTSRGTFQKYFSPHELRAFVRAALGIEPVAVAPGIVFVFRDPEAEQEFLFRRRSRTQPPSSLRLPALAPRRSARTTAPLPERLRPVLEQLWARSIQIGRMPERDEVPEIHQSLARSNVSIERAFGWCLSFFDESRLEIGAGRKRDDLLIHFALGAFSGSRAFKTLPPSLRRDVRSLFGSFASAQSEARRFLFSLGADDTIEAACGSAVAVGLLKRWGESRYHFDARKVEELPAVLRALVGCAGVLVGDADDADVVTLNIPKRSLAFHYSPNFSAPLSLFNRVTTVYLRDQHVRDQVLSDDRRLLFLHRSAYESDPTKQKQRVSLETRIRTVIGNPDGTLLMARYGDVASNLRQPQD